LDQQQLPDWEEDLIEAAIKAAEDRLESEARAARRRAVQLAREQGYHRLAVAIDRPSKPGSRNSRQLSLFGDDPTLFDDDAG
jgi:hypothetical protein